MWLGLIVCEWCFLVQRDELASELETVLFDIEEYVHGCKRCGWLIGRYILH